MDGTYQRRSWRWCQAIKHYQELLTYVKSAVTRNYSEKSINNLLDYVEKVADDEASRRQLEQFYAQSLDSFKEPNNERLWLKPNLKLARLWFNRGVYEELSKKLRDLHRACQDEGGTDDPSKGTYSLEIYALEIQMYSILKNIKRLKVCVEPALDTGVLWSEPPSPHPFFPKNRLLISSLSFEDTLSTCAPSPISHSASQGHGHHS